MPHRRPGRRSPSVLLPPTRHTGMNSPFRWLPALKRALATRPVGWLGALALAGVAAVTTTSLAGGRPVDFNREVRPILNERCMSCHGGVKRAGGLSLLFRSDALQPTESGRRAIVPGDAGASELLRRITHPNPDERMPPHGAMLADAEVEVLRRWIDQGARWDDHWAYVKPRPQPLPRVEDQSWPRGGIDRFVLARLEAEGLAPTRPAGCAALIRRVSLDLIGLPPTPEEADAFCRDRAPGAYERVVDRLLASPRFGEHWAAMWLDLARYADTRGYERDVHRDIWRYRDWVIDALNRDLPFDRFTTEQLAGDLIPGATDDQILATAFHRNTMTNDEGGTDDEEFRVAAVLDRVNTTWEVWQGTTMACVQCHSHPYDPFRHRDYYGLVAFFNNTSDADWNDETPRLPVFGPEEQRRLRALLAQLDAAGARPPSLTTRSLYEHVEEALYPRGRTAASSHKVSMGIGSENEFISPRYDGAHVLYPAMDLSGVAEITFGYRPSGEGGAVELRLGSPEGRRIARAELRGTGRKGMEETARVAVSPTEGRHDVYLVMRRAGKGGYRIHWFYLHPAPRGVDAARAREISELQRAVAAVAPEGETPVLQERPPGRRRVTRVFERGNWLVHGDTMAPDVPGSLPPLPDSAPRNRLGLARWLVSPDNPLTARVTVNRFWAQLFGTGIVETLEDFGTQGASPSHPELLDWLALRFMNEHQWSTKALLREMVLSATYRQHSGVSPELLGRDPGNRLLARGPRVRLSAEQVRDQALSVSGLLSDSMHGPGVMPPQPPGLWNSPYNGNDWRTSRGEDRYRRAVYTYLKRTVPYPSMLAFDAPSREVCVSRRIRTNTPLQALATLNDPVQVEAAQALARQMARGGARVDDRLRHGYRRALARDPDPATLASLRSLYHRAARFYRERPEQRRRAVEPYMPWDTVGAAKDSREAPPRAAAFRTAPADSVDVAALGTVAGVILNLDSFLTKE
jgi:hypothetical protein